jgi:hypothetical protein
VAFAIACVASASAGATNALAPAASAAALITNADAKMALQGGVNSLQVLFGH